MTPCISSILRSTEHGHLPGSTCSVATCPQNSYIYLMPTSSGRNKLEINNELPCVQHIEIIITIILNACVCKKSIYL
jgi:hypothetical protein